MVSISLLVYLIGELACYLAIAHLWFGASWPMAILAALGGLLGLRVGLLAITWAFASAYGDGPPISFARWLRMVVAEYFAFLALFVVLVPFEWLWMGKDRLRPCGRPLLLVHGYGCSRGAWAWMRRRLEAAGYVVATVSLSPPTTSIDRLIPALARRVEEVCAVTGAEKLTLVAHSMGGLVCRGYLARFGAGKVDRLITVATPNFGTELARVGIGQSARQMELESPWLMAQAKEAPPVPTTSIRNAHDNFVLPSSKQRLPGAADVGLSEIGHLTLLFSEKLASTVIQAAGAPH